MIYDVYLRPKSGGQSQQLICVRAYGDDDHKARDNAIAHAVGEGVDVDQEWGTISPAAEQDLSRHTDIDQIRGLPEDLARAVTAFRGFPVGAWARWVEANRIFEAGRRRLLEQRGATGGDGAIYCVDVRLTKQVHAQALGFTKNLYLYAWGGSASEAQETVRAYLLGNDVEVDGFNGTRPAHQQDAAKYTFPEQIHGLPTEVAREAIRAHDWGSCIEQETFAKLASFQAMLASGRETLAQRAEGAEMEVPREAPRG
jgi:hypothetical protein